MCLISNWRAKHKNVNNFFYLKRIHKVRMLLRKSRKTSTKSLASERTKSLAARDQVKNKN